MSVSASGARGSFEVAIVLSCQLGCWARMWRCMGRGHSRAGERCISPACYGVFMRTITLCKVSALLTLSACFLPVSLIAPRLLSQETGPQMPADPTERMLLAAKVNGLTGGEMQPWHLKASFQWMDENGNVKDQGTIEEWWAAPTKNRVTYTLTGISQTFYQTEHGRFRSGFGGVVPELAVEAQNEFASPLPAPEFL